MINGVFDQDFNIFSEEQSKTVNEYKFRVQKAEAEVATLQANVSIYFFTI